MYDSNYLVNRLRAASLGRDHALFAQTPEGKALTYGEMFAMVEQNARALVDAGLKPGDRVAVQVEKSIQSIQLYLGTVLAGGIFLPLNTAYTAAELEYFLGDAEPAIFVCDPVKSSTLQALAEKAGVSRLFTLSSNGEGTLVDALAGQSEGFEAVPRGKDDLAAILYTSGTTGRSKGAMLSHENLASNAEVLKEFWHFSEQDVLIHALPIFHTHGLFVATNTTLCAGSSLIFMPRFDVDAILNSMPEATVLMGVPTFYVRLLESARLTPQAVAHMRLFISGSAPLLAETHKQWQQVTGTTILERYGMTETNMNTSNPYAGKRCAGTVGFPLPGVEIRIADPESGDELPQGAVGSIEIRGPNVFNGYWRMPEKTSEEFRKDGFFISGDLGMIDDQGYISIVGRSKDLIISGGYNIYPKEIELLIDDIEGVYESAVIGVPHTDFGEAVVAVVVTEPHASLSENDLLSAMQDRLARYKQPKKIFFTRQLPRNTMGKVMKNVLRDEHQHTFG